MEQVLLLVMAAQEQHPQFQAHRPPMQGVAAAALSKVELLVLVAQVVAVAAGLLVLTITELLEQPTQAVVVVADLFKQTQPIGLEAQAAQALSSSKSQILTAHFFRPA
jgi:hypothetical protein